MEPPSNLLVPAFRPGFFLGGEEVASSDVAGGVGVLATFLRLGVEGEAGVLTAFFRLEEAGVVVVAVAAGSVAGGAVDDGMASQV